MAMGAGANYSFDVKTIETHGRAFLPLNILAIDRGLTYAITIGILLIKIGNRRTIITRIPPFVITIGLSVFLIRIGHQWTIVRSIGDAIIVRVVVASITNTVPIGVLLSGIWCFGTIVLTTFLLKINVK